MQQPELQAGNDIPKTTQSPNDGLLDEEVAPAPAGTRTHPDEYYDWDGSNFEINLSEAEYFKNTKVLAKYGDLYGLTGDVAHLISHNPNLILPEQLEKIRVAGRDSESGKFWRENFAIGVRNVAAASNRRGAQGMRTMIRAGATYRYSIPTDKGGIGFAAPKLADSNAPVLAGQPAMFRMQHLMGRSPILQIPLVHSGFWVSLNAPSNKILINLYEMISQEKIDLGRNTHGMAFSALSAYTARIVMQVLQEHIHDTTLKIDKADKTVMDYIQAPDLNLILMGWARTIWPKGFNLIRAEATPEGAAASRTVSGVVDLSKMVWFDTSILTPWQKTHLANRNSESMTTESVERYQKELAVWQGREMVIKRDDEGNPIVKIMLRVPTLNQYFTSSQRWVDGLVELVESTLTSEGSEAIKNNKIGIMASANMPRQHTHWIEKFTLGDQDAVDQETIEQLVDSLSGEDSFNEDFATAVREFTEDVSIAVVGIPEPNFKEVSPGKNFSKIIPIDPLSHFFSLLASRALRIAPR